MGARLLQSSNWFTASFYAIVLKLGRTILDISPHSCSESDFSICSRGAVGARFLQSSNRFTAYSSYSIDLKLGRILLDISPHNHSEPDFSIFPRGAVACAARKYRNHFTAYSSYSNDQKLGRMKLYISPIRSRILRLPPRGRASWDFQIDIRPILLIPLIWNLIGWYWTLACKIVKSRIFPFFHFPQWVLCERFPWNIEIDTRPYFRGFGW